MTDPTEPTIDPEPFTRVLHAIRSGALHAELTDELAALAELVMETGKAGTLTLQLKVSKAGKAGHQMLVTDAVSVKAPKAERAESFFFFDSKAGSLTRKDPLQPELPLQEVPRSINTNLKEA